MKIRSENVTKGTAMQQIKVILVIGYSNTRINDVKKIQRKALEVLNAKTILCKKSPTEDDKNAVDYAIDVDFNASPENVNHVMAQCKNMHFDIIAILPFSDPGTQLGAALARELGLSGNNPDDVLSALDKSHFRKQEKLAANPPANYLKITSQRIHSYDELLNFFRKNKKLFLKPACEGNSRGCMAIHAEADLKNAWLQIEKYLSAGIVAEQLITNAEEYSWDHVNGFFWITEKETTQNGYRAEVQQIVPAQLSAQKQKMITDAAQFMASICGYDQSACHNEVFFLKDSNQVAAVEPNLRPAGMRIWDLATLSFKNFNPWEEWIKWATNQKSTVPALTREFYSGIRMIGAKKNGILKALPDTNKYLQQYQDTTVAEIVWTKKLGDTVSAVQKDNSDYIGYIIAKSKHYDDLKKNLLALTGQLEAETGIEDIP